MFFQNTENVSETAFLENVFSPFPCLIMKYLFFSCHAFLIFFWNFQDKAVILIATSQIFLLFITEQFITEQFITKQKEGKLP